MKSTAALLITIGAFVASAEPLRSIVIQEPMDQAMDDRILFQFPSGAGLFPSLGEQPSYYLPNAAAANLFPSLFDAAANLYDPRSILIEGGEQQYFPDLGYFPNFELAPFEFPTAYEMPSFELPAAYELPAFELPSYETPSPVYLPELASGRNTYVNRLPMKQIYLKPVQLEEQFMFLPEQGRTVPLYNPPAWPAPAFPRVYTHEKPVIEQVVLPTSQQPAVELIDASYATHIDTPVADNVELAAPVVEEVKAGGDEVIEKVANAITPEIADAAAALGLRPRRVWDRETVIDLLGEADAEEEEAESTSA